MTISELERASEELDAASEAANDDETRDRLRDQAEQISTLAAGDGADHGRLARHQHALSDIAGGANETVTERVENAREHIRSYRETVEGV